eukprot:4870150-Amphidinium_carterae.1
MWAEVSGEVEAVVLRYARAFLELQRADSKAIVNSYAHFHLSLGAMLKALHCHMPIGSRPLSLLATFAYDPSTREENRCMYMSSGTIAIDPR